MTPGRLARRLSAALCVAIPACIPASVWATARQAEIAPTRDLYLLLIRQARADGRPRAALAYLADFERRYPGDLAARILHVNCLLDLGRTDAAEAAAAGLPATSPDGENSVIRGHILAARGDWEAAAVQYRAALAASPADPLTRNALGYAELRAGHPAYAAEMLKAASDLAPTNTVIRNNLLLALTLAGRGAEAEAVIRKIPDAQAAQKLRGQLALEVGRLTAGSAKK
jgi:Flp pilus assembly protein TadD